MSQGTSAKRELRGSQEPRIRIASEYAYTYGDDASELASAYGLTPDPWQKLVLDDWLAYDSNDKYAHKTCMLNVPRQNGKNGVLEVRELYGMTVEGEKILHTAHEVKTARKAFDRLLSFFENEVEYPELVEAVKTIRKTNGQEAIILTNGGSIEFSARSKGAARGFTVDIVVCDEAQELTDEQLEALMPTKASAPLQNSQLILLGTPPGPTTHGEVFPRTRRKALEGSSAGINLLEWSVECVGDVTDETRWEATNPALGYRLDRSAIEAELDSMSEDGFARERLGWWSSQKHNAVIDADAWDACATDDPPEDGIKVLAVKCSPDNAEVTVSICVKPKDGAPHVEIICTQQTSDGLTSVVDSLMAAKDSTAQLVIDGQGTAQAMNDSLVKRGYPKRAIIRPKAADMASACSTLLNAVNERQVTHYAQEDLDAAAKSCSKRVIGSAGGWGFDGEGATLIEAAALAYWGAVNTKRDPNRKQRML